MYFVLLYASYLCVRTADGGFLAVAFTKKGDVVGDPSGKDQLIEMPRVLRRKLIDQCQSGEVDLEALREALKHC